jgi:protease IV
MKKNPVLIIFITAAALGALFFIVLFFSARLTGRTASAALTVVGSGRVALVKIEGVLVTSDNIVDELHDYAEDSSIKAIVIRIDSPGDLQRGEVREKRG